MKNTRNDVHFSSKNADWETPPEFFAKLHEEFDFTLDPCCTEKTAKTAIYLTQKEDGLKTDWAQACIPTLLSPRVFMNPPYGRAIALWMAKAFAEWKRGAMVVCLVPSRTDTAWWHDYAMKATEIRYVRGRITFVGSKWNAPFPAAIVIFNQPAP